MHFPRSFLLVTLTWLGHGSASAQEFPLEGLWEALSATSTGISSDNGWSAAARIEGKVVSIATNNLRLPDGTNCAVGGATAETWHDDMWSFGSFGGTWSDLGLVPDGFDYVVELHGLDCETEGPIRLILQKTTSTLLMDVGGRVFVPLARRTQG